MSTRRYARLVSRWIASIGPTGRKGGTVVPTNRNLRAMPLLPVPSSPEPPSKQQSSAGGESVLWDRMDVE